MERGPFLWKKEQDEEEEEEQLPPFPIYSSRSQQDMSAVVSALVQVIGGSTSDDSLHQDPNNTTASLQFGASQNNEVQPLPSQDQGTYMCGSN